MLSAYSSGQGSLTTRLLTALNVAESAGGDLRGRQSAAILVVPASGDPWATVTSLRVEDHPDPLVELARLTRLDEAYRIAGEGDDRLAAGRHDEASALFRRACELAPESDELRFWAGLGAAQVGDMDTALADVRAAIEAHAGWLELLRRLTPELAPSAPAVLAALDGQVT
jgi:tetratricopeptide (TPR) repeat protein